MATKPLKSIKWPNLPDRYWVVQADGSYQQMTVGNAEQLVATVGIEDKVPYNFRTSGGANDIGDREVDKVIGVSYPWNQLIQQPESKAEVYGITRTAVSNGGLKYSGTSGNTTNFSAQTFTAVQNHVYFGFLGGNFTADSTKYISWKAGASAAIVKNTDNNINNIGVVIANGTQADFTVYPQVFDLTLMFGSTIADYIYSLETSTPGAGVAYFRSLFPAPYYAYDTGTLMHVQTSAHKMTGFNQWDEEWEAEGSTQIKAKNATRFLPNTLYYLKSPIACIWYYKPYGDPNATVKSFSSQPNSTFTTPADVVKATMYTSPGYGATYKNDICISLHWDGERDGEYEPYEEHTYPLDSDLVLRGIPKLDANNNLYYDGDTYESDGTVTRKYGIIDLGTLDYITASAEGNTRTSDVFTAGKYHGNLICTKYKCSTTAEYNTIADGEISITNSQAVPHLRICDSALANKTNEQIKTALSGVYLVYELATPTTEEADPYQNPQVVNDWGTEEYVDSRTIPIPVGHDTMYRANLRAKLEMLPNSPDSNGDYIVRHLNGVNTFVELIKELPTAPTEDGSYHLKCTVASGTATLTWEEDQA